MALLTDAELTAGLDRLPGWTRRDRQIEKVMTFPSFPDVVAFLVRVAFEAERVDHHPDVAIHYRRLTVTYWTHSEGGVTQKDLDGAATIERLLSPDRPIA